MTVRLKKLKGRSLRELQVRSAQTLAALGERYGWSQQARLPDDAELLRAFNDAGAYHQITSAEMLRDYFRQRAGPAFFAAFDDCQTTLDELHRRWPSRQAVVVAAAERLAQGHFKLLGFDDLYFGSPIDWHLEPIAGKRAPRRHWSQISYLDANEVGDKKIIWELNRHQYFVTLGQAYLYTRDERYAETFIAHLTSWMDANPPKLGINWASSLEVALRAIAWLWAFHFFNQSPSLTPAIFARALKFLYLHARHLETHLSTYFSPNTHLTGEALGLFYLGLLLPEFRRATRWRSLGWRILMEELDRQVRPDGVYFEQTSYYHRYTTDFYTHLLILARRHDLPSEAIATKLVGLLDHLMHLTKPNGATPLIGDDDGGHLVKLDDRAPNDFRATLATGAALCGRGDYKYVAGEAAAETLWLLGPQGLRAFDDLAAQEPAQSSRAFVDGGYYTLRDGWTRADNYLLIDCGPHGSLSGGHAHADALSFEFAAGGADWLLDPGTFTYTGDARARDHHRGTAAHNTATVDGCAQSTPAGPFAWQQTAQAHAQTFVAGRLFDYFAGAHNGYERLSDPVTHQRHLAFIKADIERALPAYVVVCDRFTASAHHRYALHYQFAPECRVEAQAAAAVCARRADGQRLMMHVCGSAPVTARVTEGWVSRCYGQRDAAPAVVFQADGIGEQSFITCLAASGAGGSEPIQFAPNANSAWDARPYGTNVAWLDLAGQARDVMLWGAGEEPLANECLTAQGEFAWARTVGGRTVAAALVSGRMLECADGLVLRALGGVRHCFIERQAGALEILLTGASCFDLTLPEATAHVVINGQHCALDSSIRRAAFVQSVAGWRMNELES